MAALGAAAPDLPAGFREEKLVVVCAVKPSDEPLLLITWLECTEHQSIFFFLILGGVRS